MIVSHAPNTSCPSIFDMTGRAKWQAWEKASKEWGGKPDTAVEGRYLEIVRQFGWTEPQLSTSDDLSSANDAVSESKPTLSEPREHEEEEENTGGGLGMGASVSQIARPPEDLDVSDEDSLHGAVLENDPEKLEKYIASHDGIDLDEKDEYGFTALHLAADRGYLSAVKVLLAKGANIGVKDPDGHTAVSLARVGEHYDILAYLEKDLADGTVGQGA